MDERKLMQLSKEDIDHALVYTSELPPVYGFTIRTLLNQANYANELLAELMDAKRVAWIAFHWNMKSESFNRVSYWVDPHTLTGYVSEYRYGDDLTDELRQIIDKQMEGK